MTSFTAASKADFQHQLQAALAQHVSEQALPQVALFAEQFFGIIALEYSLFATVTAVLAVVAFLATVIPAIRASKLDAALLRR